MQRRTLLGAAFAGTALALTGRVPAYAQGLNETALAAALKPLDPAVSGALVRVEGSAGRWRGRAGVGDVRSGSPVPWDARFRIGSMTKAFTATAVLQLVAAGLIELDAPVRRYLPERLPEGYPGTVRQLLDYTSGLRAREIPHKERAWFLEHRFDTFEPGSQVLWDEEPLFTPGDKQVYGNVSYIVAGLVIERVTGRPYADAIRRGILRPLGLRHTYLPGTHTAIPGPHAHGYELIDGEYVDVTRANPSLQWAAAEMISTAADLDRFLTALLGGRLLPARELRAMLTVPKNGTYGCGLSRLQLPDGREIWGKSGDRPGYNNGMGATRDLSRRLVYSVNTLTMGGDTPAIVEKIMAAALS
ncbi:serine hydrolase domain-containing protein [Actinoplanes philippinensis]|uniref:serine hydrolase domain-containing protein n=1 Tax=Actinoplanes philippinensis TaxID=35752 RepID=UPI0033D70A76